MNNNIINIKYDCFPRYHLLQVCYNHAVYIEEREDEKEKEMERKEEEDKGKDENFLEG